MTLATEMQVSVRLPTGILFEGPAQYLFAVAENGAFGMLPNHIDFVTVLVPSVLTLTTSMGDEHIFGIDEGLLVKNGHQVEIAIRRGVQGDDLQALRNQVKESFVRMDEDERTARSALSRLEADVVRQFVELRKPQS